MKPSDPLPDRLTLLTSPPDAPRLLVADADAPRAAQLALDLDRSGFQATVVSALPALHAALAARPFAAVLVDSQLLGGAARPLATLTSAPVLVIGEDGDLTTRLEAVRTGGEAFLLRPLDHGNLIDRLQGLCRLDEAEAPRVMLVEASQPLAGSIAGVLREAGMQVSVVHDPATVITPLIDFAPDLLLVDSKLPGCSGQELATAIRQVEPYANLTVVFLRTGDDAGSPDRFALDAPGAEGLTRGLAPRDLIGFVNSWVRRARGLRALIQVDPLTGLLNRTAIEGRLDVELTRAQREGLPCSIVMLDVDHFKAVNDTHGHQTGDCVLRTLSRTLRQRLRRSDAVGRYGGEEFLLVLPGADGDTARALIDNLRLAFSRQEHAGPQGPVRATFSAGLACFNPRSGQLLAEPARWVRAADEALYRAKQAGRNQVVVAPDAAEPDAKASDAAELERTPDCR